MKGLRSLLGHALGLNEERLICSCVLCLFPKQVHTLKLAVWNQGPKTVFND